MGKLQDKVAIVTGGGSGMGRAGSVLFAREGAKVIVSDINLDRAEMVAESICADGGHASAVQTDVAVTESVQALVARSEELYGGVDVLYTNANDNHLVNTRDACVVDLDEEVFDRIHAIAIRGVFLCAKYAGRSMIKRGRGAMVFTSTVDAQVGSPNLDAYTSAKGGILAITRSMAASLCRYNIRVNAICPGFIDTEGQAHFMNNPDIRKSLENLHMLGIPKAEDLAPLALFLASDDAAFLTGGIHQADSGYLAFKTKDTDILDMIARNEES